VKGRKELKGLCMNCIHAPTCIFLRDADRTILQCEEYECSQPETRKIRKSAHEAEGKSRVAMGENASKYMGLCVNCIHRETCTFPKPDGGVWHCEEYE
jgi:hypothetical protein